MRALPCAVVAIITSVVATPPIVSRTPGALQEHVLYDSSYHRARRIWVYTPPGYDPRRPAPYPLIVAFDDDEYRDTMPLSRVLDSLAATGRTPAFVAVLVTYTEVPGGNHGERWWRLRLATGIAAQRSLEMTATAAVADGSSLEPNPLPMMKREPTTENGSMSPRCRPNGPAR